MITIGFLQDILWVSIQSWQVERPGGDIRGTIQTSSYGEGELEGWFKFSPRKASATFHFYQSGDGWKAENAQQQYPHPA